tara:strand:+ start:5361 stop:7328 length:1968 start_codon:yes stop_codon:yes gene_type:complete
MVKAIKKRTQAQTPAPKKDRIKGSKANPKGSASGSRGGIEISEQATKALENMRDKHNAKFKAAKRRVDLGALKAVYRRGAGAFSVSHRPGMTRNQWALARVRTFLKLVATGQRKKAYTSDLDLLPKGHPQHREAQKKTELLAVPDKYSHIDFTPPKGAQDAGKRALEVRASKPQSQRGMTSVGIARARDLANGKAMSPDTVRRMLNYFTRHEVDKQGSTWSDQGKGWQAWHGWGGDAGFSWAKKVVRQMNTADSKTKALRALSESSVFAYNIPENLTVGRPFKTLGLGQVSSRMSGENVGKEINMSMLAEMVRVFKERKDQDPVVIDWQHATSPYQGGSPAPPESGNALGLIIDLELKEDGLYAIPAYNERGLKVVKDAGGVLWSSPEFLAGEVYDRLGGAKVGDAQLLAVTLTPRPAQSHDQIDRVILNERLEMDNIESMSTDELRSMLIAKDEMVKELEDQIKKMKQDSEASMRKEHDEDDKEKMAESEDDKEKMAESKDDKEKMAEKKDYKMSEQLSPTLLSEINALRENNAKMSARIEAIEAEKAEIEKREAVGALLRDGRISPAEETVAGKAWQLRELQPEFWQMFNERSSGSTVPLSEVGHGASRREINKRALDAEVKKLSKEKSISYSEALTQFRANNADFYNQVFGG